MKPLQPIPQCVDCLMTLARDVVKLAAPENPGFVEKAEDITRKILEEAASNEWGSPQIANRILRKIRQVTGIEDPYSNVKAHEMAQARTMFSRLKNYCDQNLRSRVSLAALGNSLDFFKNPAQALAEIPELLKNGFSFFFDHIDHLDSFLAGNPEKLLYVTDNAGEIYFDIPLYDYLKKYSRRICLVVKGAPSLNDLTRVELQSEKLIDRFDCVADTGTDGAGIDWSTVSRDFLGLVDSADLIVSKGMANFETLYPKRFSAPIFYIFKVKCEPIETYVQAPFGSFIALWEKGTCDG